MSKPQLVVLSGAGISAESGLNTFRDSGGLWEGFDVYEVASPEGWSRNPARVLNFYNKRRQDVLRASPNDAHLGLAELESFFKVTVITQNIDDLHERAGSSKVIHLHGEILKMRSNADETLLYPYHEDINLGDVAEDGAQLRPHVVWFGEAVPMLEKAALAIAEADIFVVIGTSLNVYPAAGLLDFARQDTPKFVIDKKIPPIYGYPNLHKIEKPATEGLRILRERLLTGEDHSCWG